MSDQVMQEVLTRLDKLAAQLGEAGAFSWEVLVRQAYYVNGWWSVGLDAVGILFFAVCLPLAIWMIRRGFKASNDRDYDAEMLWYICATVLGVAGLIIGLVSIFDAVASIKYIVNPEYYALRELLGVLK